MVYLLIALVIIALTMYLYRRDDLSKVMSEIKDSGWEVYLNASNCGYCVKQLQYLKEYSDGIVVHCDNKQNNSKCRSIRALPTWVNRLTGETKSGARLSVESLKSILTPPSHESPGPEKTGNRDLLQDQVEVH
tara:strand:+ start:261 stop:659 length:399 start_codon:yes stop_codon:yes gene_type:complete